MTVNDFSHLNRRSLLDRLTSCVAAAPFAPLATANAQARELASPAAPSGWFDVKRDFHATGDGTNDDTAALQKAINVGSDAQRPIQLPPGVYKITRPMNVPPNTMLLGSAPGLGFGCIIEPSGCAAFVVGGKTGSFHCAIENLMIRPKGASPKFIISIDNSYSVTFRNIRIHDAQDQIACAVLLLGDASTGGHGRCNDIIWDNVIIRNDTGQPPIAILASRGCGTHRFFAPCLENYRVLLEWRGGQLDLVTPYTERAGQYAVNCNLDPHDETAYLNTFGGTIDCAMSGEGCAIRETTRNFNSFGTQWGGSAASAAYVYSLPLSPVNFFGIVPNLGDNGRARYNGVAGWQNFVNFSQQRTATSAALELHVPAMSQIRTTVVVSGVTAGKHWARVVFKGDPRRLLLSAFVSGSDRVTLIADNPTGAPIELSGMFTFECAAS
jgi:hypothetical protein